MRFDELGIIDPILKALRDKNYESPTPIQEQSIPIVLEGTDVMGCAQTGTGKTAAFSIPIIQRLEAGGKKKGIKALILTPTRELAIQIDESIRDYNKYVKLKHTVIFGGVKQGKQVAALKGGIDILVATPGRLLDLIDQGFISLAQIEIFVLDEADRMLDMGFIHDIKKLLKMLPKKRQSLFFSATMPNDIVTLSRTILYKPKKVEVAVVSSAAETVTQYLYKTNKKTKKDLLFHVLKDEEMDQVLMFARTKRGADRISKNLKKAGVSAAAIHGDKAQNQRQKSLKQFKEGKVRVLVATDIAARGIDINKLRYVINYEIPDVAETYVHRIGRSGRAGEEGVAISFCEPEENVSIRAIEKLIKQKLIVVKDNPFPQTDKPMTEAEKKEFNKEKQRRKQEFFANRKAKMAAGGGKASGRGRGPKKKDKPKGEKAVAKRNGRGGKAKEQGRSSEKSGNQGSRKKGGKPNAQGGGSRNAGGKKKRNNRSGRNRSGKSKEPAKKSIYDLLDMTPGDKEHYSKIRRKKRPKKD